MNYFTNRRAFSRTTEVLGGCYSCNVRPGAKKGNSSLTSPTPMTSDKVVHH